MVKRPLFFATLAVAAGIAVGAWRVAQQSTLETFTEPKTRPPEAAPLCPWREPESDLKAFFPGATRYEVHTWILSGLRSELTQRLGRVPSGDENALRLCQIYRQDTLLGSILTRRAKGEYGGIEVVLATDTNLCVRGLRLQRLREPQSICAALQDTNWLRAFVGKRAEDPWQIGADLPEVPAAALFSARAVVQAVKSLLVLATTAENSGAVKNTPLHHA